MLDSKSVIDLYTDWCIAYVAAHQERFNERYFASISRVVNILNNYLHIPSASKQARNAYSRQGDEVGYVDYNELIDRVYLKGGCVADHYGGVTIKPSDIDCSVMLSNNQKLLDENVMKIIATELGRELKWFYDLLPSINDHESFYALLESDSESNLINIFNSYSGNDMVTNEKIDEAYTDSYKKMYYTQTVFKRDNPLIITRFHWKNKLVFRGSSFTLKINIVDLSAHEHKPNSSTLVYPRLKEEVIYGHKIWTENIYAMLNDQILTYCCGVIRNDKKLIKRKTRVLNIINQIDSFDEIASFNLNNKDLRKIIRENFNELIFRALASTEMYPYIILVFMLLARKIDFYQELSKITKSPLSLLSPQSGVFDKVYEFYDLPQKTSLISENIRLRLNDNKPFIDFVIRKMRTQKTTNNKDYIIAGGDYTFPTEDDVVRCIKGCDSSKVRLAVKGDINLYNRWMQMKRMPDYIIRMKIIDEDYKLYTMLQ